MARRQHAGFERLEEGLQEGDAGGDYGEAGLDAGADGENPEGIRGEEDGGAGAGEVDEAGCGGGDGADRLERGLENSGWDAAYAIRVTNTPATTILNFKPICRVETI